MGLGSSRSRSSTVGVFTVWTTKLIHKIGNDPVEVKTIVKATVGQVDKISRCNGHLVRVQFGLECAHAGLEDGNFLVGHGNCLFRFGYITACDFEALLLVLA